MSFDVQEFRKSFPQLERRFGPRPLIYFDNGASSLKHSKVTEALNVFNRFQTSNVHRGAHLVSRQATEKYEGAREAVAKFIGAGESSEIIFTRGTTESINLVASGLESLIEAGDEIVISPFEHHSNIVPWQVLCEKKGAKLKVIPFDSKKGITLEAFESTLTNKTKLCALIHYSNSFGNRLPVEKMVDICKSKGVLTLVDGAQSLLTEKVNVSNLQCDFFAFSGHKIFGPYGVGALYGRKSLLQKMPPYQTGGSMIDRVTFEKTIYADVPQKFEAGTPNISGVIGLGAAIEVLNNSDIREMHQYVDNLREHLLQGLTQFASVQVINFESQDYTGVVSFNMNGAHSSDVGALLDKYGIAIRAGHHCTQPLMDLLGVSGTVRVSFAPYNTANEINTFLEVLRKVEEFF